MRPDAQRYWRPDAERLMSREALKALGWQDPYETHSTAPPLQAHDAWNGFKSEHEWLKHRHDVARLRLDWELFKLWLKARKALHPSNFQPRAPAGNPETRIRRSRLRSYKTLHQIPGRVMISITLCSRGRPGREGSRRKRSRAATTKC